MSNIVTVTPHKLPFTREEYEKLLGLTGKTAAVYEGHQHMGGWLEVGDACRLIVKLAQDNRRTLKGSEDYPPWTDGTADTELPPYDEAVTWHIRRRRPANIGGGLINVRETTPRIRATTIVSGAETEIRGQRFDNEAQFDLWAKSRREVEELARWFDRFVIINTGVVMYAGVQHIVFLERFTTEARPATTRKYFRSSVFLIRTEELYPTQASVFRHIRAEAQVE